MSISVNEPCHLTHVEEVLTQAPGPMEAMAGLAAALIQDAEEGKSVLCSGNEGASESCCILYQEVRGGKAYYRIFTSVQKVPEHEKEETADLIVVSMDEILERMKTGDVGFLFNPGTPEELAVDPEMVPFLQSMVQLSVNREVRKFSSDSKQVTEAADRFSWD